MQFNLNAKKWSSIGSVSVTLTALSTSPQDEVKQTGETGVEETILEGHIGVTKELLAFQTPEKKYYIGCEKGGANLIKVERREPHTQFIHSSY